MITWARIATRFEGVHNYPAAPDEVPFLRDPHRHIFHVTLWIEQFHDNRDVEYIMAVRWLDDVLGEYKKHVDGHAANLGAMSCEMIARSIIDRAQGSRTLAPPYTHRRFMCEVLEDGENGALVEMV